MQTNTNGYMCTALGLIFAFHQVIKKEWMAVEAKSYQIETTNWQVMHRTSTKNMGK